MKKKVFKIFCYIFLCFFVFNMEVFAGENKLVWDTNLKRFNYEVDNGWSAVKACFYQVTLECRAGAVSTRDVLEFPNIDPCSPAGFSWGSGYIDFKEQLKKFPAGSRVVCEMISEIDGGRRTVLKNFVINITGESSKDDGSSQYDQVVDSNLDCDSWGILKNDFKNIFDFIKVLIPLLIVGLSTYDFIKAISNKDDKDIKKAFNKLMKRMIFAVIFFFLPILLEFLLELIIDNVCVEEVIM